MRPSRSLLNRPLLVPVTSDLRSRRYMARTLSPGRGIEDRHQLNTAIEQAKCPTCYVVTGVSGSGKSTVGKQLADRLECPFYDGDDFHPQSNRDKMNSGHPLTDEDRLPWLQTLSGLLKEHVDMGTVCVLACSCLKLRYRRILSGDGDGNNAQHAAEIAFVLLQPSREELERRVRAREESGAHFMPASLLDSQLKALEVDQTSLTYGALKPDEIVNAILSGRTCSQ